MVFEAPLMYRLLLATVMVHLSPCIIVPTDVGSEARRASSPVALEHRSVGMGIGTGNGIGMDTTTAGLGIGGIGSTSTRAKIGSGTRRIGPRTIRTGTGGAGTRTSCSVDGRTGASVDRIGLGIAAPARIGSPGRRLGAEYGPAMSAGERDALFDVMDSMTAGSVPHSTWRSKHPSPCVEDVWPGLVCEPAPDDNDLVHVTRLDFGYKPNPACGPNATLPASVTKLSWLKSLFIFGCFDGSGAVNNMSVVGSYLAKLGPSMRSLSMRSNSGLVGEIPGGAVWSEMGSLELLGLSQNNLTGRVPAGLAGLKRLQHLDLSGNFLSGGLPREIGGMESLVILDMSGNEGLAGPIPAEWGGLRRLEKLDLSYGSIAGLLPEEMGRMGSLRFFAASGNRISGPIPDSVVRLPLLQYLLLDGNPIGSPLPEFAAADSLMALSMGNSGLLGSIPESLGSLPNLSVLSLANNQLTGPIPSSLARLQHLYQMDLSNNKLSGEIPFPPGFVEKLGRNLDLSNNTGLCVQQRSSNQDEGRKLGLGFCPGGHRMSRHSSASVYGVTSITMTIIIISSSTFLNLSCLITRSIS